MKHMLRLSIAADLFLPLLLCSGCAPFFFFRPGASVNSGKPQSSRPSASPQYSSSAAPSAVQSDLRYCRQLLSGNELDLYLRVLEAVRNAEPTITGSSSDLDATRRMVNYVRADYPELFWLLGVNSSTIMSVDGVPTEATIEFRYSVEISDLVAAQARVEAAVQACLSGIDPTWGDPLFSDGGKDPDYVSYNYFCVTSQDLFQTHTPDDTFPLPECTATARNYFARNGLILDRYDYDAVLDIMRRAVAERRDASFRFTSSQALAQAVEALTRKYDLLDLVEDADGGAGILDISTVYHSTDKELNIFTVYFTFR